MRENAQRETERYTERGKERGREAAAQAIPWRRFIHHPLVVVVAIQGPQIILIESLIAPDPATEQLQRVIRVKNHNIYKEV
jgi:hypothetical protein